MSSPKTQPPLTISLVSIGGRGTNILNRLKHLEGKGVKRIAVGHNNSLLYTSGIEQKIELPHNPLLQNIQIENYKDFDVLGEKSKDISRALEGSQIVFLIGNVSTPTNVFQTAHIAKLAREKSALVFYISATPYAFEGSLKLVVSGQGKELLEDKVDGLLIVDSNKILARAGAAKDALTQVDKVIGDMINMITELVLKFGVINVDFADLKTTVQDAGMLFFNSAKGKKEDVDSITENIFTESILGNKNQKLKKVLYVIYAGKDLVIDEIKAIGEKIQTHLDDQARIIFGFVEDEKLKNSIRIVLIGG